MYRPNIPTKNKIKIRVLKNMKLIIAKLWIDTYKQYYYELFQCRLCNFLFDLSCFNQIYQ